MRRGAVRAGTKPMADACYSPAHARSGGDDPARRCLAVADGRDGAHGGMWLLDGIGSGSCVATRDREAMATNVGETAARGRWSTVAKTALLLAITGGFCLLLGEVGTRLFLRMTAGSGSEAVLSQSVSEFDPGIGVRLLPHAEAEFRGPEFATRFRTNGQRQRDEEERSTARAPGERRILLAGDSFTFGHGVDDPARFGERLEAMFPDLEVINTAVWGTGTDQQYLLYLDDGRRYETDLVILGYFVENIVRNGATMRFISEGRTAHKPRFVLADGVLQLTNVPVPEPGVTTEAETREKERWNTIAERQGIGVPIPGKAFLREHSAFYKLLHARFAGLLHRTLDTNPVPYPEYDEVREEWQVTRALFSAFADSVRANGSDFLLVIIPTREFVLEDHVSDTPNRMIVDYGRAEGIPVLDLLPVFRALPAEERAGLYYRIDSHWTPRGHEVAAEAIAEYLRRKRGW